MNILNSGHSDTDMLCRNGCGFYGSLEWQGNCSRCWTGMTASEKLEAMAATQQMQLPQDKPSTMDRTTKPRMQRTLQKNPRHICMYCGQRFTGDVSRYRAHLWNHQQKVRKFWYHAQSYINKGTGIARSRHKYFKKRPNMYIFLWQDPSKNQSVDRQDSLSGDTNGSEDSFDDGGSLKCRFCDALFTNENQLVQHEKFHSTQRPYTCTICGQSFKIRGHLARHEIIHQRNEKHCCDFCNATFAKTSQLKVHRVIHLTGESQEESPSQVEPLEREPKPRPKLVQRKQKKVRPLKIVLAHKFSKPKVEEEHSAEEQMYDNELEVLQSVDIDYIQKKAIEQRSAAGEGKVCQYCTKRCASARDLMEHERKHTGEKPHKCPICSMKTARKSDLTKHMRTMHPVIPFVRCTVCDALFTSQDKLEIHQKIHIQTDLLPSTFTHSTTDMDNINQGEMQLYPLALTKDFPKLQKQKAPVQIIGIAEKPKTSGKSLYPTQSKAPLACQYCPRVYTIRRDLVEHERTHTGEKPYACSKCAQRFHRKSNYFRHRQICKGLPAPKRSAPQMFGCFYCEEMFPDQHSLMNHQRTHTPAKTGLSLTPQETQESDLKLESKKGIDRLFPCKFCNKRFLNRAGLVVHEKSHKGSYAFKCRHCGRRFLTKSGLVTHENMHLKNKSRMIIKTEANRTPAATDNAFVKSEVEKREHAESDGTLVIDSAGQAFDDFTSSQTNYRLPSCDVKVNKKFQAYKCRYCSKVCGKYANLLVHEKLHTHGNRYKCKKCGKGFDVRRRLKQHENTHKEYVCQICTKSFLRHLQLIRHVKSAHKNLSLLSPVSIESSHSEKHKPSKRGLLCMYCGHRFCRRNKRLLSHMRSHRKRYGKYWYIKAANVLPVINYPQPEMQPIVESHMDKPLQVIPQDNSGLFKCRFCEKVCSRKMYLEQHEVIHTANRRFQCNTCGLKFCKLYQLTRHKKKAHKGTTKAMPKMFFGEMSIEGKEDYEDSEVNYSEDMADLGQDSDKSHVCHFCNAVCDTRENLLSHEKSHGPEGELTYTCKFCPMVFFRRTEYERHERTHTGEKPYMCNICGKAFNRTWNLKIHRLNVHGVKSSRFLSDTIPDMKQPPPLMQKNNSMEEVSEGTYKDRLNCKFCGKHLMSEWSLRVHERTHTQQNLHHCRVCGMGFSRNWNLKKHLQSAHGGRIDAKTCNICQKEFANPSNLRKHLKQVHMIKNPFVSKYSLPTDLPDTKEDTKQPPPPPPPPPVGFIKTQNLYSLKCDKCGKRFRDTFGLRKHKMTICGGGRRQCHICKQAFSNSSNLNRHIISHTGQKPFKCDICQRGFFQSTHLTRHMSLHSGKRPFACNLCKSNFSSQALLDHHKLTHIRGKSNHLEKSVRNSLQANDRTAKEEYAEDMTVNKVAAAYPLTNIKGYKCLYCEANFIDQAQLRLHERAHLIELPFRCQICFKLFETNTILEQHEKEHTSESGKFKIEKESVSQKEPQKKPARLLSQVSEEVDKKPQICGYCSKAFTNSNELKRHIFLVHNVNSNPENNETVEIKKEVHKPSGLGEAGKVYPCVLCRKNFSSSSNRSRHFRIFHKGKKSLPSVKPTPPPAAVAATPVSSTKRYFCQPCNRSYSSSGNLSKHRRIHHGQKPKVLPSPLQKPKVFVRPQASKSPIQKAKVHPEVHTNQTQSVKPVVQVIDGVKKYFCLWCNKSFSNSGNLSRHKRLFHNQKPTMGKILGSLLQGKKAGTPTNAKKSSVIPHQPKLPIHSQKSPSSQQYHGQTHKSVVSPRSKGGKFACNMCDRTFTQSTNLSRHKRNFHGVKPRVPFPTERQEIPKKKEKPDSSGGVKFGCLYCHAMFSLKSALIEHQATHTTKSSFMCQHCDMTFSDSNALISHEKEHMESNKNMECRFCGQSFTNRGGLTMHERSHKGEKRYQCRHCFKTFFNKAGLMSHERCHAGDSIQGNFEEISPKQSSSKQQVQVPSISPQQDPRILTSLVKTHEATLDQTRPHGCEWCDKRFLTTTDLKRHIRTHTGEQPYPCPHCSKRFSQSQNLKKHLFVIHKQGMPLASWNLSDTQMHPMDSMPVLTPEKEIPDKVGQQGYKCRYCSKVCSALRYLMQHERVHTGGAPQSGKVKKNPPVRMHFKMPKDRHREDVDDTGREQSTSGLNDSNGHGKRHQCDLCPKAFGSSGDLVRHVRTHTGEKPFECPICLKQFSRNHHLKLHQESVHASEAFVTPTEPDEETPDEMYPELPIRIKDEPLSDEEDNGMMEYPSLESYPDPAAEDEGMNYNENSTFEDNHEDGVDYNEEEESSYANEHVESMESDLEVPPVIPHFLQTSESFEDDEEEEEMESEGKQCQFCTKSFITIHDLRRHEITHTGKEQYMCGVCNTTFSNEDNLISHSLIHSKQGQ